MKKSLKFMFFVALSIFALASCKKEEKSAQNLELELYYYKQENQEGLKAVIAAFEQANPGIKIKTLIIPNNADAQMIARAAQGDLPDIIQMQSYSRVREYAAKGYLVDLSGIDAMKAVLPSSLPAVRYNGNSYALPTDFAGIGVIYNKDIFAKYNLSVPTTFSELEEVCDTLADNGIVPFAALLKENWSVGHFITLVHTALLQSSGVAVDSFIKDMNEGKTSYGVVDTAELFKILDFYRDNMNENAAEMGGAEQQQSFAKGESAMMVQGLWSYADAKKLNTSLNAGFFPFPVYDEADKNVFYADVDSTFGVSSQSSEEKRQAAIKFLNWITSNEGQQMWVATYKLIPPFKGVEVSTFGGPYVELMDGVEKKGSMPWAFSQYPSDVFEDACKNGAQQYMMHKRSAADVIKAIDDGWKSSVNK